jgi:nitrous oxidase accessory protein
MPTETEPRPVDTTTPRASRTVPGYVRAVLGAVAVTLLAGGWLLPLWSATLHAPQYPGGLHMHAYGHQVTGDVGEIDSLNHYVGMRPFDPADVPEMQLWPAVLAVAVLAVIVALVGRPRWAAWLAKLYLWATPVGVLGAIQLRLHQYGHELDPLAALRLEPFTPWVVGPTKVWNFTTWARPGLGLVAILLAAAVVTFGPRAWARWAPSGGGSASTAVVVALAVAALLGGALPAGAADHDGHTGHGGDAGSTVSTSPRVGAAVPTDGPRVFEHPHAGDLAPLLAEVPDGGRLVLPAGTYHGPVVIDRPVTIEGEGLPLIVGDGTGDVLTVTAPGTVLQGIAVRGSGPGPTGNPAAIRITADDVRVEATVVEDAYMGIAVAGGARAVIVDNTIRGRAHAAIGDDAHAVEHDAGDDAAAAGGSHAGHADAGHAAHTGAADGTDHAAGTTGERGDGIWLHDADQVLIRGNLVLDARDGIYTVFGDDALVDSNVVLRSRYALHSMYARGLVIAENTFDGNLSGAVLMYGGDVLALRNTITRNRSTSTGFGLLLKDVTDVQAVQNVLADNRIGIHLDGPAGAETETVLDTNTVAGNQVGVAAYSSARAAFRANSFVDNLVQVMSRGGELDGVSWIDRGVGNYWDTYRGYESTEAGLGAVAHVEGGSVDRLLLRHPELVAIADTPALRLVRSVEERWGLRSPVAVDHVPLTAPVSPAVPARPDAPVGTPVGLALAALLIVPAATLLWRRPRPSSAPHPGRSPRAVPA